MTASFGGFTMILDALPEYRADWVIAGKAASTVDTHVALLHRFVSDTDSQTVEEARRWITAAPTRSMQRKRAHGTSLMILDPHFDANELKEALER
ncbi:MAG: hypothetical protein O3A28_09690, partial [Actinomycetota bacterium]|nr:hypothetical protein [Actinomycetota bacterium]MDA3035284.1 hypothetical protein [Actinomycetota bacterium]